MTVYGTIIALLDENKITYQTEHHEPTITSADASRVRGVALQAGAKSLVLRGRKSGTYWLAVMPADRRLADKKFEEIVGEKVSFAKAPEDATGCVRGSVPPFGSVVGLTTYCDGRLKDNEIIHFNAGSLTDSVSMSCEDYLRLEQPVIVDITQ